MKSFTHINGPALKASFYTQNGKITSITLAEHNKDECCWQLETDCEIADLICEWMAHYCEKSPILPKLPLSLDNLPPFRARVLKALQAIPFGETMTYSQLAALAGNKKAYRAAGTACGRNPYPLVIPCHRILAAKGKLGGFAFGLDLKKELLSFENHSSSSA